MSQKVTWEINRAVGLRSLRLKVGGQGLLSRGVTRNETHSCVFCRTGAAVGHTGTVETKCTEFNTPTIRLQVQFRKVLL